MKSVVDASVKGKKVLVRVDFNVPLDGDKILDDNRIVSSLKTINYLLDHNAKVILLSHLGRIKSKEDKEKNSLLPVARRLSSLISVPVYFVPETRGELLEETINNMQEGEIVLVENTRFEDFPKTLESSCDDTLSKYWASLADIFVFDAFGTAHRCHASTYGISKYLPSYAGFLVEEEVKVMNQVIRSRKTLILGGSKVEDKIGVIDNLIKKTDLLFIGGAMCFTFMKADGINVGGSPVSEEYLDYAKGLLDKYYNKIYLPFDVFTQNGVKLVKDLTPEDIAYDIGPETVESYIRVITNPETNMVLWNGPLGKYEDSEYEYGTKRMMEALQKAKFNTILAGGDVVSAATKFNAKFYYASTGGGSTLEYLEGKRFKTLERLKG